MSGLQRSVQDPPSPRIPYGIAGSTVEAVRIMMNRPNGRNNNEEVRIMSGRNNNEEVRIMNGRNNWSFCSTF